MSSRYIAKFYFFLIYIFLFSSCEKIQKEQYIKEEELRGKELGNLHGVENLDSAQAGIYEEKWEVALSRQSGVWRSEDGEVVAKLDFRVLSFTSSSKWPELEGEDFLIGPLRDFMCQKSFFRLKDEKKNNKELFLIKSSENETEGVVLRREMSP